MININTVLKYIDDEIRIRIIHISNDNVYYVNIDSVTSMPKIELLNKLQDELDTNRLLIIKDPFARIVDEAKLSNIEIEKRDRDWDFISKYWIERMYDILNYNTRNRTLQEISEASHLSLTKVKKIFSRYWQRGLNKNALLPDYMNSGGKGKEKKLSENKIGRPKKADYKGDVIEGINITDEVKKHFNFAITRYYRNPKKGSLKETYNLILRDFYSDKYKENGEIKHKVWDKARIPTYDQFYYWFKKYEDPKLDTIFRESEKTFNLKEREILSNSTIETDGPGTRFQVDATVADVYLLSSVDDDLVIGRPIVYAIIDVFSRLVTGIYVGFEGPSWLGAMMALDNMVADKVEFCKSYGIEITEDQWPAKHLPDIIIADRGEFEGYSVENLINNLNIKIENTSPYRGDLKGIVERNFRITNEKIKHKTPGAIQKEYRKRGDKDYRLDATITLEEFTRLIIKLVIRHNTKTKVKYPMEIEMVKDEVKPIPVQLWNWGIENKKGRLKTVDREILRLNVLPRGKASVSRAGIKFKGLFYGSQKALEEQWFIKAKVRSVEILYDPRNMSNIYIQNTDGKTFETCYLLDVSKQYKDWFLEKIIFNFERIAELKEIEKDTQNQLDIDLEDEIDEIINNAIKRKAKNIDRSISNNKRIKGIRDNRAFEKELNRKNEAFKLGEAQNKKSEAAEIIQLPKNNEIEEETAGKDRIMEMLRRKRDEKREK
ncbi:Mu transposase C-terminal domain-containing protein [Clostridium sp. WILCCON 0269]|uniref:Mu transposase C-terminal domain-containing protein n=1 Tax=Candidatus Clostridium eludens TaxID=3381663 RepID=A0ABW8SLQ7_9CLOT